MGASASIQLPPFETVEAALTAGKTQDEIDVWHASQEGGELTGVLVTMNSRTGPQILNQSRESLQKKRSSSSRTFSMIHDENNHTVGETKSTDDSGAATARACIQKLPQYMRLQVFHSLTDLDYFYIRLTCKTFLRDYVFSVKYNLISPCLFVPSVACKTLKEALAKVDESEFSPCVADRLTVGSSIRARWKSGGRYYSGKIRTINEKGTYNITFDDGDQRENIPLNEMTLDVKRVITIVLGPGDHVVEEDEDGENYLNINCPANIVGSRDVLDKSKIVVVGGFWIYANGAHVEHLTIRHKSGFGVYGYSSCTLTDLMIDQCGKCGVIAHGSDAVLNCTNIMVSKCKNSGVGAYCGTIILSGTGTLITDNCLKGDSYSYGLDVYGPSSKIKIVKPLTKEAISKGNKGGGNFNAEYEIETIEE